jgi:hypothetical protein
MVAFFITQRNRVLARTLCATRASHRFHAL